MIDKANIAKIVTSPVLQTRLPDSVKRAIADSLWNSSNGQWELPAKLPPMNDLSASLLASEAQCKPIDEDGALKQLSRLMVANNHKLGRDDAQLLLGVWLDANGDLPPDLWEEATLELIKSHPYGMPKPADLRKEVITQFQDRLKNRDRIHRLYDAARAEPAKAIPKPPVETVEDRLRSLRDIYLKHNMIDRAARAESDLAKKENREAAAWVWDVLPAPTIAQASDTHPISPPLKSNPSSAASLKRSLASEWRKRGLNAMADKLMAEAQLIHPLIEYTPEAEYGDPEELS